MYQVDDIKFTCVYARLTMVVRRKLILYFCRLSMRLQKSHIVNAKHFTRLCFHRWLYSSLRLFSSIFCMATQRTTLSLNSSKKLKKIWWRIYILKWLYLGLCKLENEILREPISKFSFFNLHNRSYILSGMMALSLCISIYWSYWTFRQNKYSSCHGDISEFKISWILLCHVNNY